jgi:cytidylate kinase
MPVDPGLLTLDNADACYDGQFIIKENTPINKPRAIRSFLSEKKPSARPSIRQAILYLMASRTTSSAPDTQSRKTQAREHQSRGIESQPDAALDFVITIDGVAASGKSSVARAVAAQLGVPYVSSGLLYRAVTFAALQYGIDTSNETALMACLTRNDIRLEPRTHGNRAWLNDTDITDAAHSSAVDANVSIVALHSRIRAWVNAAVKRLPPPFVAEGRDMGTVAFPHAAVKLYLTASHRVRAERRAVERPEDVPAIEAALIERDRLDAVNSRPAADATVLDTSNLSLEDVVARALEVIQHARQ